MNAFRSCFADRLDAYVRLRRALARTFATQERCLQAFDRYVAAQGYVGTLTEALALDFATSNPRHGDRYRANRYVYVRHFADYLALFDPQAPRLDPRALPWQMRRPPSKR